MKILIALATVPLLHAQLVFIGTYTSKEVAPATDSKGIYAAQFDAKTGKLGPVSLAAATPNPSFVALHPSGRFLYAVNELPSPKNDKPGLITAFSIDKATGKLTQLNQLSTKGAAPCHVVVDATGKSLLVSNYNAGSFISYQLGADGKIGPEGSLIADKGALGPVKDRQDAPHSHELVIAKNNQTVLGADLALDRVLLFRLDAATARLTPLNPPSVALSAGTGPRHIAVSPDQKHVYVLGELSATITQFDFDDATGALKQVGAVSTVPAGFQGKKWAAEIAFDASGKHLYSSNRADDESIAVFDVDARTGALKNSQIIKSGGKTARVFAIDPSGQWMLVGHQDSNNITVFRIDAATGKLTLANSDTRIGAPVSLQFAP